MDEAMFKAFLVAIPAMTAEKKVKLFLKTREAKSAAQKAFDEQEGRFKQIMETCQNWMLKDADALGVKGFSTPLGTTYVDTETKISIADDSQFYPFVLASKDLDFFERRVSSRHVQDYIEQTKGVAPPGLNIFKERVMRVRKASNK